MSVSRKHIRTSHLVLAGHFVAVLLMVSTCDLIERENRLSGVVHFSGREFAGSATCAECHAEIAGSHFRTPHYQTSRPADTATVMGSFDSGANTYVLDEHLRIVMEKTAAGLFQVGYRDGVETQRKALDITIGSGRKGQTYLYWEDHSLFQLPASYYAPLDVWSNSPGYPPDQILFDRHVTARCLECHSTYFKTTKAVGGRETFDSNQVMLGVDCERCHGPAGDHVRFHRRYPDVREARNIVNPERLGRQQRLDNCALCHSGIRRNFMPSFTYVVGGNLEDYSFPDQPDARAADLDVHGNQYGLLSASKCFLTSAMDCSSCHDVHSRESNNLGLFSTRCTSCHARGGDNFCTQPETPGLVLSENCIDCHMPALPSKKVFLQAPDTSQSTPFLVRTHRIAIYPEQVKLFLANIGRQDNTTR